MPLPRETTGFTGIILKQGAFSQAPCLFGLYVRYQLTNIYFQIPAQLTDQTSIDPLKVIPAISVKVGAWNIQVLADLILGNTPFLQNTLYVESQSSVVHHRSLFTGMDILYIISPRSITHYIGSPRIAILAEWERSMDDMAKDVRNMTCCFTGHRYLPMSEKMEVTDRLEKTVTGLIRAGVRYFGAGGAVGFDTLAAKTILRQREEYPHIKLILVLPCRSQTQGWRKADIEAYDKIKLAADKVVYTSEEYTWDCMHQRNRHLVNHSGICVCYLTQNKGGTAYTVNYARNQGLRVINLADMKDVGSFL